MYTHSYAMLTKKVTLNEAMQGELEFKISRLDLPFDTPDLEGALSYIGIDYSDYDLTDEDDAKEALQLLCISDFHSDYLNYSDFEDLYEANTLVSDIESLSDDEIELMEALIADGNWNLREAVEESQTQRNVVWYPNRTMREVAEEMVDEEMFDREYLLQHIDYDSIAEDLMDDDSYSEVNGGVLYKI